MDAACDSQCLPHYRLLTTDQIREVHQATLEILETIGVRILDPDGVQLLRGAGCRIDRDHVVHIPLRLVEECIRSAPSRITIYDRMGQQAMRLEGNNIHFGPGTDLIQTRDLKTGELRPSCLNDVVNAARVADCCDAIDFIASFALPHDVSTNTVYIESFKAMVENSCKPIFFTAAGEEDLSVIFEIAAAVVGGEDRLRERPFLIHYSEPTSPLSHSQGAVRKLFLCADRGVPINYTPALLSGASGPVTLAGVLTVANAEALSGIVLHQLRAKGAPIISGFAATLMDMGSSTVVYAAPEFRLTHSACADLYHFYQIPVWGTAGCSDAHRIDPQAAMEAAMSILLAAMDGANLIHDIGYLGQGLIGSPAAIVMCDEIISYVKRIIRGCDISRDRLGMDVISRVGPGGNFLGEDQTLTLHREEHWRPLLLNRDDPETWMTKGGKSYRENLIRKTIEILENHQPEPLPDEVRQTIDKIVRTAKGSLAGRFIKA